MFRVFHALITLAAALAPFVLFAVILGPLIGMMPYSSGALFVMLTVWWLAGSWAQKHAGAYDDHQIPLPPPQHHAEAPAVISDYTPPAHFDLLLAAKHDIGRVRGAVSAIEDGAIAEQLRNLANRAETILDRLMAEPAKLGLARRFLASYLPRTADLAGAYPRFAANDSRTPSRRAKLLDVLYRLDMAMKEQEVSLAAPEMDRLDADLRVLSRDLKDYTPDFTQAPEPILNRVDEIVKAAKKKKG